jgi:hypothetical protein
VSRDLAIVACTYPSTINDIKHFLLGQNATDAVVLHRTKKALKRASFQAFMTKHGPLFFITHNGLCDFQKWKKKKRHMDSLLTDIRYFARAAAPENEFDRIFRAFHDTFP